MLEQGYWSKVLTSRVSRRRALAGAATFGAGAAALSLVGCGGGDEGGDSGGSGSSTELTIVQKDMTSTAKVGGTWRFPLSSDPPNLDPNLSTSFLAQLVGSNAYSRLLKFQTGEGIPLLSKVVGDAAEKYEVTDAAQTWTFTIRKDMKFQPKGPASVSNRLLDSEDVKASWEYMLAKNGNRKVLQDLVDQISTPDKNTFVVKLKQPYAPFQELMASSALFWIMSKQAAAGDLDTQKVEGIVGTGPFMLVNQERAVVMEYKKHPEWYEKRKIGTGEVRLPLIDGHQVPVIPDPATQQSQFIAGNTHRFTPLNTNLVDVAKQSNATKNPINPTHLLSFFYFNLDNASNPMKDERLRRGLSMAIDRAGIIDTIGNISALASQGYEITSGWNNSPVPWGDGMLFWWLNPQDEKAMGSSAKWYKYDVKEAKALISAAGYSGGSMDLNVTLNGYADPFPTVFDTLLPMLSAVGLKAEPKVTDYQGHYLPEVYTKGIYNHMAYGLQTPYATVDEYLFNMLVPEGNLNHSKINDTAISDLVKKQRLELDVNKRQTLIYDIQKKMSEAMYYVPSVSSRWGQVQLFQPYVRSAGAFRTGAYGEPSEQLPYVWFDKA